MSTQTPSANTFTELKYAKHFVAREGMQISAPQACRVVARPGSTVLADCATVFGMKDSVLHLNAGSTGYAKPGCRVYAEFGSTTYAQVGASIYAEDGAIVYVEDGFGSVRTDPGAYPDIRRWVRRKPTPRQ